MNAIKETKSSLWNQFMNKFFNSHNYSARRKFYNSTWSILFGFFIIILVISIFGYNPFEVLISFFKDANNSIKLIPTIATYVFAALAIAICFKGGIFNIGVPGQMMFSGFLMLVILKLTIDKTGTISSGIIFLSFLVSILSSILMSLIIGVLKAYLKINEVVTSIMLNWIVFFIIRYIVGINLDSGLGLATSQTWGQGYTISVGTYIPSFFSIQSGGDWFKSLWAWMLIIISIVAALMIWFVIRFTKFGYKIKMVGLSKTAAEYSGTNQKNLILITMVISGFLSGCAAFIWYILQQGQIDINVSNGPLLVGFNAIAISLIVFDNPIAILLSSLLFSTLSIGSENLTSFENLPKEMTNIVSGIFIYSAALAFIFSKFLPYQWTRNFIVLVKDSRYRKQYWRNWKETFKYSFSKPQEWKKLIKLWKKHHKEWNAIKKEIKLKEKSEEKKLSINNKFNFEKLTNDDQIEYLNFLAKLKKEKDYKLAEAHYFEKNNIKTEKIEEYHNWKHSYEKLKKEILDHHFNFVEEKLYDSTEEIAAKERERLEKKKKGSK